MELWTNGASSQIVGEEKGRGLRGEVTRRQHHLVQGAAVAGAQKRRSGGATVMMRGELGAALALLTNPPLEPVHKCPAGFQTLETAVDSLGR